jgi:hypothetical protein
VCFYSGILSAFYKHEPLAEAIDLANEIHLWPLINLSSIEQRLAVRPASMMVRSSSEPIEWTEASCQTDLCDGQTAEWTKASGQTDLCDGQTAEWTHRVNIS